MECLVMHRNSLKVATENMFDVFERNKGEIIKVIALCMLIIVK